MTPEPPPDPPHPTCPFCLRVAGIHRRGEHWFCEGCLREWLAYTEEDKQRLKLDRIANDEA